MAKYKYEIAGAYCVEADSMDDIEKLRCMAREEMQSNPAPAPSVRRVNGNGPSVASTVNADKWVAITGNERFRVTKEEKAKWGEGPEARENAARDRLIELGEEPIGNVGSLEPLAETVDISEESFV